MNNPNGLPPAQTASHRPPFPHQSSSYRSDYGMQNGRPSPSTANPQSPQMMTYSSLSPQYSPLFSQAPPPKRLRLSEEPSSALSPPSYPQTPGGQSRSPVLGQPANGLQSAPSRPGAMPPPQRPADRPKDDENYEDVLSGTGINVEEEERNLARPDYYSRNSFQTPFPRQGGPGFATNPLSPNGIVQRGPDGTPQSSIPEPSPEEQQQRIEARADWDAARHSQTPLWDMFLYGGNLNDRIRKVSLRERLADPQSGVLVNTQRTGPPPVARVNGLEGATRVIDRGQAILDSENKGQRLSEIMKLVCLATKTRLTGLVGSSARLSLERRQHSGGRVPTEWEDIAVLPRASSAPAGGSSEKTTPLKRTYSQANEDDPKQNLDETGPTRIATVMQRVAKAEKEAEEARRAKNAKRKPTASADASTPLNVEAATEAELMAAVQDAEKKTSKKGKQTGASANPTLQHQSANEVARMATAGLMGSRFGGKKQKTYSWMKAGASGTSTPTRPVGSTPASAANTPSQDRIRPQMKEKRFGGWEEDKEPGIQLRDVLPVLETDGMAARAFIRGCERMES